MDSARVVQAIIRGVVVAVTAAVAAIAADAANIIKIGTDDPILTSIASAVLLGVIQAIQKWIGGATVSASRLASASPDGSAAVETPNIFAV